MKKKHRRAILLGLCACIALGTMTGCSFGDDIRVNRVKKTSDLKVQPSEFDREALETTADNWHPVQAPEQILQSRNPFRGFADIMIADAIMRQQIQEEHSDAQLPEQLYPTREYRVIGVITGTADPKVYIMDPGGNRFILRRGSLIGNSNGSISSIRRDGIEVYERVADKGQYIELPLYEQTPSDKKSIQLSLQ